MPRKKEASYVMKHNEGNNHSEEVGREKEKHRHIKDRRRRAHRSPRQYPYRRQALDIYSLHDTTTNLVVLQIISTCYVVIRVPWIQSFIQSFLVRRSLSFSLKQLQYCAWCMVWLYYYYEWRYVIVVVVDVAILLLANVFISSFPYVWKRPGSAGIGTGWLHIFIIFLNEYCTSTSCECYLQSSDIVRVNNTVSAII